MKQLDIEHMTDEWIMGGNYSDWDIASLRNEVIRLRNTLDKRFTIFAMACFSLTKITALIGAVIIAVRVNLWIGAILFVVATVYRLTWYIEKQEKNNEQSKTKGDQNVRE